jgi:MFS transporter, AAHS family, 3-hydroxyphenylpropionic acid transporter
MTMEVQQTTKELNTFRVLPLCAIVILLECFDIQAAGVSATKLALALFLAILGFLALDFPKAMIVAFGIGAMVTVAQATLYAFAPLCYSASIRNTGVGAAVAAGRLGTIAGPLLAGSLLRAGRTAADVLIVLIPITLVSGTMTLLVVKMFSKQKKPI